MWGVESIQAYKINRNRFNQLRDISTHIKKYEDRAEEQPFKRSSEISLLSLQLANPGLAKTWMQKPLAASRKSPNLLYEGEV